MATKKDKTEKKKTTKKTTTKKTTTKKVEKPVEVVGPIVEEEVIETEEKVLEVMNGDPTVVIPVEESNKEEIADEEPKNEAKKKITRKINRAIGYFWNGQMIDF